MLVNFILDIWLDYRAIKIFISVIEEEVDLTADAFGVLSFLLVEIELVPVDQNSLVLFPHVIVEVLSDFVVDTVNNSQCLLKVVDNIEFGTGDVLDLNLGALRKRCTLSLVNESFVLVLLLLDDGQVSLGNLFGLFLK